MLDKAIEEFLENKKQAFLKKKINSNTNEEDTIKLTQESQDKFNIENWLLDSSKRAKQLSLTSHPAKFVHPNAKASSIIVDANKANDGLLRSGNVEVDLDIFGNAAALDVEKFLRLELQNKKTILQQLESETDYIKQQFNTKNTDFEDIRDGYMQIKYSDLQQTSEKLKQVYFPIKEGYHLLSVLVPSGMIYKLKQKINNIRFSDEKKILRDELKKAKPNVQAGQLNEIYGLTAIGYGGTQPQNISTLNSQNGGVSFLLSSMPPLLKKRKTQPPKKDFFNDCLWAGLFKTDFEEFHKVLVWRKNNKSIRDKRDDIVLNSIIKVKRLVDNIRNINSNWSKSETYDELMNWQKIWLDQKYVDIRDDKKINNDYITKVQSSFSNWFIGNYKHTIKDNKLLGNDDIHHIKNILKQEQELLK